MLSDMFPETIMLGELELKLDLAADLTINDVDLDGEFANQALTFAKYSTAYDISLKCASRVKAELDALAAQIDVAARKNASSSGIKLTEKMADHTIKGNTEYLEKTDELLQAQQITGLLKSARDAMIQKKEMLIQLGFSQRQERAADITMKANFVKSGS